jgi:CheY-like chemotaxis protein
MAALNALETAFKAGEPFKLALIDFQMPDLDGFGLAERIRIRPELQTTMIMMLSSVGHRGDAAKFRDLGVSSYLTKPVRQSVLLDALLSMIASKRSPESRSVLITRHSLNEARRTLRILLAEDNAVNQRLVTAILQKQGHVVKTVGNGRLAVEAVELDQFDLVLMDVQMPEMDGLEATAEIRRIEEISGNHLPIIALTANAMKGDREKCMDAGADGYLPKPLNIADLSALIESVTAANFTRGDAIIGRADSHGDATSKGEPSFDINELYERVEGDKELMLELLRLFREQTPQMMAEIRRCAQSSDSAGLRQAAHSFKGACANLGARPAMKSAFALEVMGRENRLESVDAQLADLAREAKYLERELDVLIEAATP